ncbi:MAG: hypothetical protein H6R18_1922 [Proteobacteria bacterium]|nr:hypothetical protein [Pseudomonadota bacterium]
MSIKKTNRSLFLAMHADAKDFPGGIRGLAEFLGRNGSTLGNQLNPDHDAAPPSMEVMVDLMKLTNGKRTAFALAQLVGQVPMDMEFAHHQPCDAVRMFMALVHEASQVFGMGSEFASDLRFDADERKRLEPLLLNLMKATAELLQAVRG